MPSGVRIAVQSTLRKRLDSQTADGAKTETWLTLRELAGLSPLSAEQKAAALAAIDSFPRSGNDDIFRKLPKDEFDDLPNYTRRAILDQLGKSQTNAERSGPVRAWSPQDNAFKVFPAALAAKLDGTRTQYADRRSRNASDIANFGQNIITPADRVDTYRSVNAGPFAAMSQPDQDKIKADLARIAADPSLGLPLRYDAQRANDIDLGNGGGLNATQISALVMAAPGASYSDGTVSAELGRLSKADYDSLKPVYREAIDDRVLKMAATDPAAAAVLGAKFHPAAAATNPSGMAPTTVQANVPPHVQEALDTIYGVHPKSHTMAHQLKTYAGLRGSDFGQLNQQEQNHLLSDLSFIQTTAKGPSADKARKLIDRFTPPGTPSGQTPTPAVIPPANSVPGQVRYATPLVGTLVQAKDKGTGGDGWTTTPGGRRVWGKYGAAGLLLQHVDQQTGEKRYLMVQRGPGISDPGKWQFPGGAIDSKETFHQGGTREVIEELGFSADALKDAAVHGEHTSSIPGSSWKYVSIAAQVPKMLKPDLSTHHAQMETSDAKWMTEAEIRKLDTDGKLLAPLAGGKLEQNVLSLFPQTSGTTLGQVSRPGPVTRRLGRMTLPSGGRQAPASFNAWPHAHKPSTGKNLVGSKADIDTQRQKIKNDRKLYDGKTADGRLAAIGAQQGFDDTPTVVSKSEIDRLLATGDYIEAWRGVSGAGGGWSARSRGGSGGKTAADINEEMRSGPAYYGKGIFGNGYYLATDKRVAQQYADGTKGSVVRMLIPKTALTDTYDKVEKEAQANSSRLSKAKGSSGYELSTFWDPGRWGAAKGLDGIEILPHHRAHGGGGASHVAKPGKPAYNWLNRAVLIIQKEPG
jgi:8-oxo-dGTP diphosphatase